MDFAIVGENETDLKGIMVRIEEITINEYNMKINEAKTKLMVLEQTLESTKQ